jgi:hypothetical protein
MQRICVEIRLLWDTLVRIEPEPWVNGRVIFWFLTALPVLIPYRKERPNVGFSTPVFTIGIICNIMRVRIGSIRVRPSYSATFLFSFCSSYPQKSVWWSWGSARLEHSNPYIKSRLNKARLPHWQYEIKARGLRSAPACGERRRLLQDTLVRIEPGPWSCRIIPGSNMRILCSYWTVQIPGSTGRVSTPGFHFDCLACAAAMVWGKRPGCGLSMPAFHYELYSIM